MGGGEQIISLVDFLGHACSSVNDIYEREKIWEDEINIQSWLSDANEIEFFLVSQLCHTTWFISPIKVSMICLFLVHFNKICFFMICIYRTCFFLIYFFKVWLLTSYDMDCDIVADAKCRSASVPIKGYISHFKDIEFLTFQISIFAEHFVGTTSPPTVLHSSVFYKQTWLQHLSSNVHFLNMIL